MNELDRRMLEDQLGRSPRGVQSVEVRSRRGEPVVIRTSPLLRVGGRVEPFPTLFWLTHPTLRVALSHLESEGWVGRLEAELEGNPELRAGYEDDHRAYAEERWSRLTPDERQLCETRGWVSALKERGIGGIANPAKVKCLHLQWAHHLARGSSIGRWLEVRFSIPRP